MTERAISLAALAVAILSMVTGYYVDSKFVRYPIVIVGVLALAAAGYTYFVLEKVNDAEECSAAFCFRGGRDNKIEGNSAIGVEKCYSFDAENHSTILGNKCRK